ncbi:hypothetical protein C499_11801 [Halogeometricum borinquense DSM 11551]|uniref:DUF8052 domain-containing protein n=2 Tax=Halogeometricum borinquense TaxID=60847 RepID=E4NTE2_HALBP|nr:hypothetical protein [Halogeometricum borinquense]ADQ65887.1 hypothetical protein Hbor_02770 [Halogeometricum borinquense DSM 11551]ELY26889.1 hypothetical protein C499_11801 [Halogeometricum borinquense DSM 11551]RYJ14218.1 hypothetical protein ELS19_09755 [Halogeometricum borinquense]
MSEAEADSFDPKAAAEEAGIDLSHVPDWEDSYLDKVSDRLMFNYDLEKDRSVSGERFDLFGEMRIESEKHFIHPALNYANHESHEFLFARRVTHPTVAELERLVGLGHELADGDDWFVADEEHFGTDFTFVLVANEVPADVREFVAEFSDRTLIKFGYYGHYEVNLAVVAPDEEDAVASQNADVAQAFTLWDDVRQTEQRGVVARVLDRLRR